MSFFQRRSGPGTLAILSLLLASSGALRLGAEVGQVLADTKGNEAAAMAGTTAEGGAGVPEGCPAPPAALAAALAARAAEIDNRAATLDERMAALDLAEQAITARMAELEASENKLRATLQIADGAAEKDLVRLTAVYEAMKPKDAAALFEAMEAEFAAGFLGRMRPELAAAVLSGMKPQTAYTISALIAGRNALAPKE